MKALFFLFYHFFHILEISRGNKNVPYPCMICWGIFHDTVKCRLFLPFLQFYYLFFCFVLVMSSLSFYYRFLLLSLTLISSLFFFNTWVWFVLLESMVPETTQQDRNNARYLSSFPNSTWGIILNLLLLLLFSYGQWISLSLPIHIILIDWLNGKYLLKILPKIFVDHQFVDLLLENI